MSKNKALLLGVSALICAVMFSGASRFTTAGSHKLNAGRVKVDDLNRFNSTAYAWQGRLAAATARAKRDLFTFKARVLDHWRAETDPDIMKYYGDKPDDFFLRFLQIEEHEKNEETAGVIMITNYAKFMNARRKEGVLNGLGAKLLHDAASSGYIRVMSSKYRDSGGRRIILTKPALLTSIPDEHTRSQLYLYWFLKLSTYDDAVDPGFVIAHDFSDVSLLTIAKTAATSNAKRMLADNTFPMNLKKILVMNYGNSWGISALTSLFKTLAPSYVEIVYMPYATTDPEKAGGLYSHIPKASLPTGAPYQGEADEDIAAALKPGLGALYESEMDPEENKAES